MKLYHIAKLLGCELLGEGNIEIEKITTLDNADAHSISFYHNPHYKKLLDETKAGAVIISPGNVPQNRSFTPVLSNDPLDTFRRAMEIFYPPKALSPFISHNAVIHHEAKIGKDVRIEPFVVIERAKIGSGTAIGAGTYIGDDVEIGDQCVIFPRVVIYPGTKIGNRVIIHSGAVIGCDGFGYSRIETGEFKKIPHVGIVVIEDDVEIGANTTIDRATLGVTKIGKGTKIDNLVQIGHNVEIGENCALAGQVGVAGSCKIGNRVLLGGQVGLAGHLELGDDVVVYAQSGVDRSFHKETVLLGSPAKPAEQAKRQLAALSLLPEILKKLKNGR